MYIYAYVRRERRVNPHRNTPFSNAPRSPLKRSTCHTHTHTDREPHPRHRHTRTRQEQHPKPPNEHLPQTLKNARRWRDDGVRATSHARVGGRAVESPGPPLGDSAKIVFHIC